MKDWKISFSNTQRETEYMSSITKLLFGKRKDLLLEVGICCVEGKGKDGNKIATPSISEFHRRDGYTEVATAISRTKYTLNDAEINEEFRKELEELYYKNRNHL